MIVLGPAACLAQHVWQKSDANPVIPNFAGGGYALSPAVLRDPAGFERMWLSAKQYGGSWSIYGGVSFDGVNWFTSVSDPLVSGGQKYFESEGATNCSVVHDAAGYRMYYTGVHDCCGLAIGLATSTDGIHWTEWPGNPVLVPSPSGWDSAYVSMPQVRFDGTTTTMWYEGGNGGVGQVGLATSTDGVTWTKHPGNPVIARGGAGSWDQDLVSPGGVFMLGDSLGMLVTGRAVPNAPQTIGLARSRDGVTWIEDAANPVLVGGGIAAWDWTIRAGSVLLEGDSLSLWYAGNPAAAVQWSIGQAVSHLPTAATPARRVTLHQNAPNPFQRHTAIAFDLPHDTPVTLEVVDVQGRAIRMLTQGRMPAGTHTLDFDMPSGTKPGVYNLVLRAGPNTQSRRMVLLP